MPTTRSTRYLFTALLLLGVATWLACNQSSAGNSDSSPAASGKLPLTTKSDEARNEYLQGQDLADKLLIHESVQHFDKAISLDPDFAQAELARAASSPTAKEFIEHLNKAVALADKVSDGEKLLILSNQAASNGDTARQKEYLDKLLASYPNDERVQVAVANYDFGLQDLAGAVEHYKKATEIAPNYSNAFNTLGYAYRQQGDYANAEQAFKRNIEILSNDPNPYDSYAELLLKMGRFDESIAQYQKALAIDSHFPSSHMGIATDLMYQGKYDAANAELQKLAETARNDGELRTAYFGMSVVACDSGKFDKAAQAMDKEYAVAEKKNDPAAMAADLQAKGNILAEAAKYDAAQQQFEHSLQLIEASHLSDEIKENARELHHFNLSALAIAKKDLAGARTHADEFRQGAKNNNQQKLSHELDGRIALAQKDYDKAIAELEQANQQDPRNLFRLGQAYQGKGDAAKSHDFFTQAAQFNSLPGFNYAFIRSKAQKMAAGKSA